VWGGGGVWGACREFKTKIVGARTLRCWGLGCRGKPKGLRRSSGDEKCKTGVCPDEDKAEVSRGGAGGEGRGTILYEGEGGGG